MRNWSWLVAGLAVLAVVSKAPTAWSAGASQPSAKLVRVNTDKLLGKPWMTVKLGIFCIGSKELEWTAQDSQGFNQSSILANLFRSELATAGLKTTDSTTDLFATHTENVEFQIGALITDLKADICLFEGYQ